jgi:hypothetical protein
MTSGRRAALSLLALVVGFSLIVGLARAVPPSREEQVATALRLEAVLARMDELGLDGWHDCAGCSPVVDIRPGTSPAPVPSGSTLFTAMQAATAGVILNGRLVEVTTVEPADVPGASESGGRVVVFEAEPRTMLGAVARQDVWRWTWHQDPHAIGPYSLDEHWEFRAIDSEME